ncbi:LOB domain-containing protein 3-like [Oryza brachyantha]|uniref:LOB domain-containing protein 3-like n=1 Tax=Oryza brachyantha TaxID=4533 RepID=UPI001ADD1BC4|nr:LOB domain-containing protein 3-like [Oryza brachyantha]
MGDETDGGTPPPPPPPPPPACAACKHQRRRCTPGCKLAPYFPAHQPDRFKNAHRVFGIKNILRLMETAGEERRNDAIKSVVYESDAWAVDGVRGAAGIVANLFRELRGLEAELAELNRQLELRRGPKPPPAPAGAVVPGGQDFHRRLPQAQSSTATLPPNCHHDIYMAPSYHVRRDDEDYLVEPSSRPADDAVAMSTAERHGDGRGLAPPRDNAKGEDDPTSSMRFLR